MRTGAREALLVGLVREQPRERFLRRVARAAVLQARRARRDRQCDDAPRRARQVRVGRFQNRPRARPPRPPIPRRAEREALLRLPQAERAGLGAARQEAALASPRVEPSLRRRARLLEEGAARGQRRVDVDAVVDQRRGADAAECC